MSHYFSRVQLRDFPDDMRTWSELSRHGEAYRDHALLWRLFPGDGMARDFVFRRDDRLRGQPAYYVVSRRKPLSDSSLLTVQTKPYNPVLEEGEWLSIELRANPTVTRRPSSTEKSVRHDVLMHAKHQWMDTREGDFQGAAHDAAVGWVNDRASKWGLRLDAESIRTFAYTQHHLRHKQRKITFSSLDYQMRGQVVDPVVLQKALLDGVGHAKAFGCGLLLVKRVR